MIIDEIGYLPIDRQGANLFFQLVSRRYERGSIIITSNQSLGAWGEVFGDPVIASAILDRLLHHSITINIKGESFRLKEKLKAGLLKPKLDSLANARPWPATDYPSLAACARFPRGCPERFSRRRISDALSSLLRR